MLFWPVSGGYDVASYASDVRIAPTVGQDAQHQHAQHFALAAGVGTAVAQRVGIFLRLQFIRVLGIAMICQICITYFYKILPMRFG